ncbi:hypothetical protein [Streptomyces ipomoeae]|uniref:hypothetical protein n=1 Tax=Streptomyces ipomoeae TaxID=103232 RepID=UPI00114727DF|nr:hypothetical protein [Streptomyces ipomoeae]TQE33058.1 hypothetical protein Sipo7851_21380 [Streptomyces ipomoeae]
MPRLASTVYVRDPEHHEWVICDAGTEPEPRLAALIRTPSAWEDGQVPDADAAEPADEPATPVVPPPTEDPATPAAAPAEPTAGEPEKKPRTRRAAKAADE